ncbi:MAG: protein kinase [Pirellulaceae bacterium]
MSVPSTKSGGSLGSTSGGASNLFDFEDLHESSDASIYFEMVRQSINDETFVVDQSKLRSAITILCAAQIDSMGQVDPKFFEWMLENDSTHLDQLFPGLRDPTHDPTAFPSSIGRFILLGTIGVGGYGIVYSALDVRHKRRIALKTLRTGSGKNERPRRQMMHEAEIMQKANCAHIVRVYGFFEIGRETVIAMELASGGNLARILFTQGKFDRRRAAEMARQVAAGIEVAHELGVIHRDLKPGNVLHTSDDRWCVGDFGLAKKVDEINSFSSVGRLRGTRVYASPEQLVTQDASEQSDIFAIGMILFESVTGKRAFDADSIEEQKRQIANQTGINTYAHRRLFGKDLLAVVLKCLQPYPEHRYRSASELRLDLANFLNKQPLSVRPPSAWTELKRFAKQHRKTTVGVLASLLLAFLLSMIFVDGLARRRTGTQLLRQGQISKAIGELSSSQANARTRSLVQLDQVIANQGPAADVVDPLIAALLKPGVKEDWFIESQLQAGYDVTSDGMLAAIAVPGGDIDIHHRDTGQVDSIDLPADQPAIFLEWGNGNQYLAAMNELPPGSSNDDRRPFAVIDVQSKTPLDCVPAGIQDEGWAFSSDGLHLVVADAALKAVRHFDLAKQTEQNRFPIPDGAWIRTLAWMPDSESIVIAYANSGEIEVRNLVNGKRQVHWQVQGEIFDLDVERSGKISVAAGKTVYIFQPGLSQAVSILRAHDAPIDRVRFSTRGDRLLTHSNRNELKLWNQTTGELLMQSYGLRHLRFVQGDTAIAGLGSHGDLPRPGFGVASLTRSLFCREFLIDGAQDGVRCIALSDDGSMLFAATDIGTAKALLHSDGIATTLVDQLPCGAVHVAGDYLVNSNRFRVVVREFGETKRETASSDLLLSYPTRDHHYGSPIAVDASGSTIAVVEASTNQVIVIRAGQPKLALPAEHFDVIALSPNGRYLAGSCSTANGTTQVWDLLSSDQFQTIASASSSLAFTGDSKQLIIGGAAAYQVWRLDGFARQKEFLKSFQSVDAPLAVHVPSNLAALAINENAIEIFDTLSWEKLLTIPMNCSNTRQLTFAFDGGTLGALDRDGSICIFELNELADQFRLRGVAWPLPAPSTRSHRPVNIPVVESFSMISSLDWLSSARKIKHDAAPIHREIEALLDIVDADDATPTADDLQSLAHKYLLLGGIVEAKRFFQAAHSAQPTAERLYFGGLLSLVAGDEHAYQSLRETVDQELIKSDYPAYAAGRICFLRPNADPMIIRLTIQLIQQRLDRNPSSEDSWLRTIMALALIRDDRPDAAVEAVAAMRLTAGDQLGSLDLFQKSVAALALCKSGDHQEADQIIKLCRKYPRHRFANLRLYAEQLLAEATSGQPISDATDLVK